MAAPVQGGTLRGFLPESGLLSYKSCMKPDFPYTLRKHSHTPCAGLNFNPVALAGYAWPSDRNGCSA